MTPQCPQRHPALAAGAGKLREAVSFLRAMLPGKGLYCAFVAERGHLWADSVEELARNALDQDALGQTVYHACASFETRESRKTPNVAFLRALRLDIDAGGRKPYADREEALTGLRRLCEAANMPEPWIVSSGAGLHVYWPLARDLTLGEWLPLAQGLKALCARHGLLADKKVTVDPVRVLRTPGTHNRKTPSNAREVSVLARGEAVEPEQLAFLIDGGAAAPTPVVNGRAHSLAGRMAGGLASGFPAWGATAERDLDNLLSNIDGETREIWHDVLKVFTSWSVETPSIEPVLRQKFDRWSQKWPDKYNLEDQEAQWRDGLRRARGRMAEGEALLGFGSLVTMAGGRAACPSPMTATRAATTENELATDLGNARRLVRRHGENLRYVHLWRKWLVWREGHWRVDEDGEVMRLAKNTVEALHSEATKIEDEAKRTELRRHALKCQAAARLEAMIQLAQSEKEVVLSPSAVDRDRWLLGVQNGVVDLRTGRFREARREDYITRIAGVAYDPDARCPEWTRFLDTITNGDEALIAHIQRAVGYTLTGSVREEVIFVLWGTGRNGKSSFRETIVALLGDYAIAADASLLVTQKQAGGATPDVARLHGCRLVAINETAQNDILNEARVKFLTGNDKIAARHLHSEFFDFDPTHKAFVTTNHKPIVRGTDLGLWRRIHLWPFAVTIPEDRIEHGFRERVLMPELPGVLNWGLEGLRAYLSQGLKPPLAVRAATEEYRADMDALGQWIEESCEIDRAIETPTNTLYADYRRWCGQEGMFTMSGAKFGREMTARGFIRVRGGGGQKRFRGLRLSGGGEAVGGSTIAPSAARRDGKV